MSHIVEFYPLTKLNGGLSLLHCFVADQLWFITRIREEEEDWKQAIVTPIFEKVSANS